jgi:hypothetical protein
VGASTTAAAIPTLGSATCPFNRAEPSDRAVCARHSNQYARTAAPSAPPFHRPTKFTPCRPAHPAVAVLLEAYQSGG